MSHGSMLSVLNYRGQGIGGVNRAALHGYLSKTLVVGEVRLLRTLEFTLEQMHTTGSAYREHMWWQLDLVPDQSLLAFDLGLPGVMRVVEETLAGRPGEEKASYPPPGR